MVIRNAMLALCQRRHVSLFFAAICVCAKSVQYL